jgi:hypothetical protein
MIAEFAKGIASIENRIALDQASESIYASQVISLWLFR